VVLWDSHRGENTVIIVLSGNFRCLYGKPLLYFSTRFLNIIPRPLSFTGFDSFYSFWTPDQTLLKHGPTLTALSLIIMDINVNNSEIMFCFSHIAPLLFIFLMGRLKILNQSTRLLVG